MFSLALLDALVDREPAARAQLERLARFVPPSGELPVQGGLEDERKRAIDLAPRPGRPLRDLVPPDRVAADLDRLERDQQPDGGWTVDWQPSSPAAALEWRGAVTVRAIALLRVNGRLPA
jgi:hypothetical protein